MVVNFILGNCTCIKYFIPIVQELHLEGIDSIFYLIDSNKQSGVYQNLKEINALALEYNFTIKKESNLKDASGLFIMAEGVGAKKVKSEQGTKVSLVVLTDFRLRYHQYIKWVDYVIFPSKFYAEYYNTLSDKNLYMGSPKYDVQLDKECILKKYNFENIKRALVLFPKNRDLPKIDIPQIYRYLRNMGYQVIVKSRSKDRTPANLRGDKYYEDFMWYPHTTMELMKASDIVINFGSTAIEECVMMNHPLVNFDIKPHSTMDFLYDYKYCANFKHGVKEKKIRDSIEYLTKGDLTQYFKEARKKHLFEGGQVSKSIVDFIENIHKKG